MRLTITTQTGQTNITDGTLAQLTAAVKADLRDNHKVAPAVLKGQLARLRKPTNGVRETSLVGEDDTVLVKYSISQPAQAPAEEPAVAQETPAEPAPAEDQGADQKDGETVVAEYRGAAKHFWRALGRQGGGIIAEAFGAKSKHSSADLSLTVTGQPEAVAQASRVILAAWGVAVPALRAWCHNDDEYVAHSRKTIEGRRARYEMEEDFLRDFCRGYASAATGSASAAPAGASAGYSAGWAAQQG